MNFTASQLKRIAESLPNPNQANSSRYHVLLPQEISPIITTSCHPTAAMRFHEPELIFTKERTYNGYEWVIEFEVTADLEQEYLEKINYAHERINYLDRRLVEAENEYRLAESRYAFLRNKWYVRFFMKINFEITMLRFRFTGKIS